MFPAQVQLSTRPGTEKALSSMSACQDEDLPEEPRATGTLALGGGSIATQLEDGAVISSVSTSLIALSSPPLTMLQ
jgi:hypothetical protein